MTMFLAALLAIGVSLAISAAATPLTRRLAARTGYIDLPRAHKAHATPTPLLGGCAIFMSVLLPSLAAMALANHWAASPPTWLPKELAAQLSGAAAKTPQAMAILAGALAMHILGLIDDRRPLGAWSKLIVQVVIVTAVVAGANLRILTVLETMWGPAGGVLSTVLSVVWLLAITNSFNFLDNMDGLTAGVGAICAATLLAAAAAIPQYFVGGWLCLILGALLGYLPYNFPKASTFMGDAGSLVVGFLLGAVSCLTTYVPPGAAGAGLHYPVLAPLVLMALPLYDTVSVMLIRLRERRNPMVGDRRHFSHRLVARGMSVRGALATIYLCTAGTAIAAVLLPHVDAIGAVLVMAQTAAILLIVALLEFSAPAPPKDGP